MTKRYYNKTKKVIAIIQARMGSTRLPGKVMKPLAGIPALKWVRERVGAAKTVDQVIIATSTEHREQPILELCRENGWIAYRGSEHNVMGRVFLCAFAFAAHTIVDITADCPLVDPQHIDHLVQQRKDQKWDYCSNVGKRTWPDGLDIQVYSYEAMEKMLTSLETKIKYEHTGWNFIPHHRLFRLGNWAAPKKYHHPDWRLTLDTEKDYKVLSKITEAMMEKEKNHLFKVEKALDYVLQYPEVSK